MRHPTPQRVSLIAIALVACFAPGTQAQTRASLSTAKASSEGAQKPAVCAKGASSRGSDSISSTYMIDDGTMEEGVGFGNRRQNFESLWMNQSGSRPIRRPQPCEGTRGYFQRASGGNAGCPLFLPSFPRTLFTFSILFPSLREREN